MDGPAQGSRQGDGFAPQVRGLPVAVLEPLTRLDDRRSATAVAATVLPLAAVLVAGWHAAPLAWLALVPVVGVLQHALFILVHEAAHYRLFAHRRCNEVGGFLLAAPTLVSLCTYRITHRLHHNHLFGALDPDLPLVAGYPRGRGYLLGRLARDLSGRTAWKTTRYFFGLPVTDRRAGLRHDPLGDTAAHLRAAAMRDRRAVIAVQLALPCAALAAGGLRGLGAYLVLWLLPLLTVVQALLRLRAVAEHGAPGDTGNPLQAARSQDLAGHALLRRVLFPHHVGFHIEHHLVPAVPHYHLPALHRALAAHGLLDGANRCRPAQTLRAVFAPRAPAPVRPLPS